MTASRAFSSRRRYHLSGGGETADALEVMRMHGTEDVAAIGALRDALQAAENAGDHDAAAGLLSEDAVLMVPDFPVQEGRLPCREFLRDVMGWLAERFDRRIHYDSAETVVDGDVAFDRGTFSFTVTPRSGGETTQTTGKYLWILRRSEERGGWRVSRLIVARDEEARHENDHEGEEGHRAGC